METTPTATPPNVTDLYNETPLGDHLDKMWDTGWTGYVFGFSASGRQALLVTPSPDFDPSKGQATIISIDATSGLGRFECSQRHLGDHVAHYTSHFPLR